MKHPTLSILMTLILLLGSGGEFQSAEANEGNYFLQQGHKEKNKGNLDKAIKFYKKSLEVEPDSTAAKSSLKRALQGKKQKIQLDKMDPECRKRSEYIEVQKLCLQKYFSFSGRPIHPNIIQDLTTWLSDHGDQVVAINIEDSQGSNRYCCESDVNFEIDENGKVFAKIEPKGEGTSLIDRGWFAYEFYGRTDRGVYVIKVSEKYGGGRGIFGTLLLLKISEEFNLQTPVARDLVKSKKPILLKSVIKRLHLKKVGTILLGDRESHTIDVDGNFLILDGKKINVPPL